VLNNRRNVTNILVMETLVTLAEAKTHFSALITEAEEGAEITVTRHGRPVARIVGAPRRAPRSAGEFAGVMRSRQPNRGSG
jgi:prevent-host-death family protein